MTLPRNRTKDRDLPPRMHRKHGAFWHKAGSKWTRLADLSDIVTAFARYAELEQTQSGQTVQDAINRYLARHVTELAPATQRDYRRVCQMLSEWAGGMRLDALRTKHVARMCDLQPTAAAGRRAVAVLAGIYRHARHAGWVEHNPCEGVMLPTVRKRDYLPSWGELDALRAAVSPQMAAAMDVALMTALRLGDMLRLTRADLSDGVLRAKVSKTKGVVSYALTDDLREALARAKAGRPASMFLIPNSQGRGYTVGGWESNWQRAKSAAGFPHIRWHDLRARALTDAGRQQGRDYAQALGAHADGSTTEIYLRDRGEVAIQPLSIVDNGSRGRQ